MHISNKSITFAVEMKMMKETYQAPITQVLIANLPIGCFAGESKQVDPQAPAAPAPGHSA